MSAPLRLLAPALLLLCAAGAHADLPDSFQPLVPQPPFSFTQRVFDLSPAFAQARAQDKPVFIYLGASDCPPCVDYTKFLAKQRDALKPAFDGVVLVDLRTLAARSVRETGAGWQGLHGGGIQGPGG